MQHAIQNTTPHEYIMSLRSTFDDYNKQQTGRLIFNEEVGHFMTQLDNLIERGQVQSTDDVFLHTAFLGAVQLGLSFSKQKGQAFVISSFNEGTNQYVPSFFMGYKGMQALVARSKMVMTMTADVVFSNDEFVFNGSTEKPLHRYEPGGDRGHVVGVYGISLLATGGAICSFMEGDELFAIEEGAKENFNNSWSGPFVNELRKKTGVRRLFKSLLPILEIDIDDQAIEVEGFHAHYN